MRNFHVFAVFALLLLAAGPAEAFNWNKETVRAFRHNRGKMEAPRVHGEYGRSDVYPGGHNLATRRAMDYAILKASRDSRLQAAMESVYGESLENLKRQDGFAFQKILWGNFSNEVQTMLDAPEGNEALVGWYMSASYSRRNNVVGPDGRHSKYWKEDTGYTSSNAIHSMLVTSSDPLAKGFTQEHSMGLIRQFALEQLESVLTRLINANRAHKDGIYVIEEDRVNSARAVFRWLRNIRKLYKGDNLHYRDSNYEYALRDLGSLFHLIQDSAVACTEAARNAAVDPAKECVEGDGHGIVKWTGSEWKIVSLSDGAWYARKGGKHAELDNLYQPGNLATVEELVEGKNLEKGVYGSFDPAIPAGSILLEVAEEAAAIGERFAETKAYIPLTKQEMSGVLKAYGFIKGVKAFARENSLTREWRVQVEAAAKTAARRIAEKYVLSRYAPRLQPLPPPPTESGKQGPHGD